MKVCTVTQSYSSVGGGGHSVLNAERRWCEEQGIEHVLIVPGARDGWQRDGLHKTYTIASPPVPGHPAYRLLLRSGRVSELLRDELPDVVETHCPYNIAWTALAHRRKHGGIVSASYMTDVPVVYVEQPLSKALGGAAARAGRRAAERYLKVLYDRCDAVIATSASMQRRLLSMGVRNLQHVPLGVDLDVFCPQRRSPAVRSRLGAGDEDLLLVYAGRFDNERRPDLLLNAFAHLPADFPARLVLMGEGPLREQLQARAAQLGRVQVLPFVHDRGEMADIMASADVYVSAMAFETFGLSVVEAQASGLAVLGVRSGAMPDRVCDAADGDPAGDGFLVDPESAEQMAWRLLATPRAAWRQLGLNARAKVQSQFSWDSTFSRLFSIYDARLSARQSRQAARSSLASQAR